MLFSIIWIVISRKFKDLESPCKVNLKSVTMSLIMLKKKCDIKFILPFLKHAFKMWNIFTGSCGYNYGRNANIVIFF